MKYIVQFSGGVGSWAAAKRVASKFGPENMLLLFADTRMEDEDLYRFLDEASEDIGAPLVRISDGRTPWELFKDKRFLGNTQVDLCSRILKRELLNDWIQKNCDPRATTIVFGIDWTEEHRFDKIIQHWEPWPVWAPMLEEPYLTKQEMLKMLDDAWLRLPRLYTMGFPHNNCGGFCVKAGMAQFAHLLKMLPERYAYHEVMEEEFRRLVEKDVAILRSRRGGKKVPMTLKELRERIEVGDTKYIDKYEWGGCGCALF